MKEKPPSYKCPRCGMVSYNPNDIKNKYCGNCHKFEEDTMIPIFYKRRKDESQV